MVETVKVFLAHASEDKEQVREIYQKLKKAGFDPWLDEFDLIPGQNWRVEIPRAIRESDIFVTCLSKHSVTKHGYIQKELRLALNTYAEKPAGSIYLIPLKLDDSKVPDLQIPQLGVNLRDIHWLDYWKPNGFDQLIRAIRPRPSKIVSNAIPTSVSTKESQGFDLSRFSDLVEFAFSYKGLGIRNKAEAAKWAEVNLDLFSKYSFSTFKELVEYAFSYKGLGIRSKAEAAKWAEAHLEFFSTHSVKTFKESVEYAFSYEGLGIRNKLKASEWAFQKMNM